MRIMRNWAAIAAVAILGLLQAEPSFAQWGTIKGQVLFNGTPPVLKPLVAKDDPAAKDAAVCAAEAVPDESLVVDPETKGIADVFVWLIKKPAKVNPDLAKPKDPIVDFDQKGCRFLPHSLVIRTDQQVRVLSGDSVAHNTHTWTIKTKQANFILTPNDRKGVVIQNKLVEERLPSKVSCDIHPWMQAWWLIVDHPYAAVTDAKGNFEIADLPVGDHEFRVWQEKAGYVEKTYKVTVKEGENKLPPIKASAALFSK